MTTQTALFTAQTLLLAPVGLSIATLEEALALGLSGSVDSADVYLQHHEEESWFLEEGIVKSGDFNRAQGFGLRVISGEKVGFAYADNLTASSLQDAAKAARAIVAQGQQGVAKRLMGVQPVALYSAQNPLHTWTDAEKVAFLQQLDRYARAKDPRVKDVLITLSGEYDVVSVLDSDGTLAADVRPLIHLSVRIVVEQNGRREKGQCGGGARADYHWLTTDGAAFDCVDRAVAQAIVNLAAVSGPAGVLPVVLGNGWPAVLLHEAVGHGLEGDFNRRGTSAFAGKMGEQVAAKGCTVIDDGTLPGRRGSLTIDDEGTPTERTVLIEEGILVGYLQDKLNARLMGSRSTGNGRRDSYASVPLPRMTNTCLLAGSYSPDEMIASVDKGIYAVDFSGGQVDITSGKFVFSASEAYLIERGRVTTPLKGATLIGSGPEVLKRVSMVGHDMALDRGIGTCGKEGQSVPVGVGQPTIKVDAMTIGGSDIA